MENEFAASDTCDEKTECDTLSDGAESVVSYDEAVKLYGTGRFQIVLFGKNYRIILADELVCKFTRTYRPSRFPQ